MRLAESAGSTRPQLRQLALCICHAQRAELEPWAQGMQLHLYHSRSVQLVLSHELGCVGFHRQQSHVLATRQQRNSPKSASCGSWMPLVLRISRFNYKPLLTLSKLNSSSCREAKLIFVVFLCNERTPEGGGGEGGLLPSGNLLVVTLHLTMVNELAECPLWLWWLLQAPVTEGHARGCSKRHPATSKPMRQRAGTAV